MTMALDVFNYNSERQRCVRVPAAVAGAMTLHPRDTQRAAKSSETIILSTTAVSYRLPICLSVTPPEK